MSYPSIKIPSVFIIIVSILVFFLRSFFEGSSFLDRQGLVIMDGLLHFVVPDGGLKELLLERFLKLFRAKRVRAVPEKGFVAPVHDSGCEEVLV